MIVTLTGAFRNAGDHLIFDRAARLLKKYVDGDILNLNRRDLPDSSYDTMNDARAIILCGGPAYQKNIYPGIYPLDLSRITTRVIPFGLGWKGALEEKPDDFEFSTASTSFLKSIHSSIDKSSCRDHLTVDVLANHGVTNVEMTGCPAWFDLDTMERDFGVSDPTNVVLSDPAQFSKQSFEVIRLLRKRFPRAQLTLALHHGLYPGLNRKGMQFALERLLLTAYAKSLGFTVRNIAADLGAMKDVYTQCDLHIGYRVHAHIYCLSQRTASLLVSEDSRGIGQSLALGCCILKSNDESLPDQLDAEIDRMFANKAVYFQPALQAMNDRFRIMTSFLESI
jgi:hypothetical protein